MCLVIVRVSLPLEEIENQQAKSRNSVFATMALTASLGVILSFVIAMRVTHPLTLLTLEARQITQGETARDIPISGRDEVGQLTKAFNALVKELNSQIRALKSEQGKLASVLKQMTDAVVIVDMNGRISLINLSAERMFKTRSEIATTSTLAHVIHHYQWVELWEKCRDTGKEQATTLELPHQGIFIQGIALPLGDALPEHVLMVFQDLTRIRRLETVRRDFISNISHELRTPLASLKALVETLQTSAFDDPPAGQRFLSHMETEVDSLSKWFQSFSSSPGLNSGQVPLELRPETANRSA